MLWQNFLLGQKNGQRFLSWPRSIVAQELEWVRKMYCVAPARAQILEALKKLRKVNQDKPGSFCMQVFFQAKSDEIINIFSQALPDEKNQVVTLLSEIDPANYNKYEMIMAGGGGGGGGK